VSEAQDHAQLNLNLNVRSEPREPIQFKAKKVQTRQALLIIFHKNAIVAQQISYYFYKKHFLILSERILVGD
jgi:hypothetical protein